MILLDTLEPIDSFDDVPDEPAFTTDGREQFDDDMLINWCDNFCLSIAIDQ